MDALGLAGSDGSAGGVMPRRILIVDDERDICEQLEAFLRSKGFQVSSVFSGEQAIETLAQRGADVLLLDMLLPGLSGIEVLKQVKILRPELRVIVVSGVDNEDVKTQAIYYGAEAYLIKPLDFHKAVWTEVIGGA